MDVSTFPAYNDSEFHITKEKLARVTPYCFSDYQHTLNDAIHHILSNDYKFDISYIWADLRLVLGYLGALIGLGGAGYAHLKGFESTKDVVFGSVVLYMLISGFMSLIYVMFESKHLVNATTKNRKVNLLISTSFNDKMDWTINLSAIKLKRRTAKLDSTHSLARYFTSTGLFLTDVFYADMMSWLADLNKQLVA